MLVQKRKGLWKLRFAHTGNTLKLAPVLDSTMHWYGFEFSAKISVKNTKINFGVRDQFLMLIQQFIMNSEQ